MTPFIGVALSLLSLEEHIAWAMSKGFTREEGIDHYETCQGATRYINDEYIVLLRQCPKDMNPNKYPEILWLSISRIDKKPVRNWQHLQSIKNEILGNEAEAVEIFPAESRRVDLVNQYHLFGSKAKFPVGFMNNA